MDSGTIPTKTGSTPIYPVERFFFNTEAEKEIEEVLEKVSTYLHKRIVSMLEAPSTQVKIEKVINQYAQSKGFFWEHGSIYV